MDRLTLGKGLDEPKGLLYHHDCPDCEEAIPKYERSARDIQGSPDAPRIALIEMPPYGPPAASACLAGRLSDQWDWFLTTPLEVILSDGTSVRVNTTPFASDVPTPESP